MTTPDPMLCTHRWVANTGHGGEPVFKPGLLASPAMHVMCSECRARTWLTREQWEALPDSVEPATDG